MATGGASRVILQRAKQNRTRIPAIGVVVAAFAGIATMGPIGVANLDGESPITSYPEYTSIYGGFSANAQDLPLAIKTFFDEGGQQCFVSRIVHCSTPGDTSSRASVAASTAIVTDDLAPTAGAALANNLGPYSLPASGLTLLVKVDGAGAATATFTGTAASRTSTTGTYNITDGNTITLRVDGSATVLTIPFAASAFVDNTAATPAEVVSVFNAYFAANTIGAFAEVSANAVKISSNRLGTGSGINVTGGTANGALSFTTGNIAGTGNVSNLRAVTITEVKTIVELAVAGCTVTNSSDAALITSNTTGSSSSIQVTGASTSFGYFGFDNAIHSGTVGGEETVLTISGKWDGTYAHDYSLVVADATNGSASRFDLKVLKSGVLFESFINLSTDPLDPLFAETVVNTGVTGQRASSVVSIVVETTSLTPPDDRPANGTYGPLAGGNDGLTSLADADFTGTKTSASRTGLRCFDPVGRIDEIAVPGRSTAAVHNGLVTYCEIYREGRTFAVMGAPLGYTAAQIRTYVASTALLKGLTEIGRFVWPRIYVANPDTSIFGSAATVLAPVEGAVVGIHARVSAAKVGGAFDQPSVSNGQIRTALGIETREGEDKATRGLLHDDNICVVRAERGKPIYLDGSDTLNSEGVFPTVGESRGVMAVTNDMSASYDNLRQLNINDGLYERMTSAAENYLRRLTENGAFRTKDRTKAYFIDFGKGINTDDVVDAGYVLGNIGLNTSPAAKFIVITISPLSQLVSAFEAA